MVALGFDQQDLSAGRHGDDIGVGIDAAVDVEPDTRDIAVPPLDIPHRRKIHYSGPLIFVDVLFAGIQRVREMVV